VAVSVLLGALIGRAGWQAWDRSLSSASAATAVVSAPPPIDPSRLSLEDPPRSRDRFEAARQRAAAVDPASAARLVEYFDPAAPERPSASGSVRVEYSLDETLTENVFEVLRRGRVAQGHAIVSDPRSGRLLAYVSTDPDGFPPDRAYPAASIVKILTAAALLEEVEPADDPSCVYRGNPYRLNRRRLERPASGREASLEHALATSNNQCFSQWTVGVLGWERLVATLDLFGWLVPPAPGHDAGRVEPAETKLALGRLGSGLDGLRVTPLHVAQLASVVTHGHRIEPWWIDRIVDAQGRSLPLPPRAPAQRVLSSERAELLRSMMVGTTTRGTARSAFRDRRGRPQLGSIAVAGKTGNLTGEDPYGRYEWFLGLAPAEDPTIAVVVLQLQSNLWWARSSELASDILRRAFCDRAGCREELAARWTGDLGSWAAPRLVSDLVNEEVLRPRSPP
jgi:cell division protein FtsI/penicillin-binding protein 2